MLLNTVLESLVLGVLDPKVAQFEDMLKCLQVVFLTLCTPGVVTRVLWSRTYLCAWQYNVPSLFIVV